MSDVDPILNTPSPSFSSSPLRFPGVWILLPVFNEVSVLESVVRDLQGLAHVVIVDDGSQDGSYELAEQLLDQIPHLHLLRHLINLGQGAAISTASRYALKRGAEILVTFDADGQHGRESVEKLLTPILQGRADVVLGSRFLPGGEAENIPQAKRRLLFAATLFTKWMTRLVITDTHNGLRAYSARAAQKIVLTQNRMAYATQFLEQIACHKLVYEEVPVRVKYTAYSLMKGQKMSNALNILWESFTEFLRR